VPGHLYSERLFGPEKRAKHGWSQQQNNGIFNCVQSGAWRRGSNAQSLKSLIIFYYKIYSIFSPTFQLPMVQMNRVVVTFGGVSVVLCVLINVLTLFAYRQKRKTLASCREFKVENKITVFTVCTFASQSAVFLLGVQKF
jgi:hypothetical protein